VDFIFCSHSLRDGLGAEILNFLIKRSLDTRFILMSEQSIEDISQFYSMDNVFIF